MKLNEVERIFRSQFLDSPPDAEVTKEERFQNWDNHDEDDVLMSLGDNVNDGDWDRIMERYIYPAMEEYARDILINYQVNRDILGEKLYTNPIAQVRNRNYLGSQYEKAIKIFQQRIDEFNRLDHNDMNEAFGQGKPIEIKKEDYPKDWELFIDDYHDTNYDEHRKGDSFYKSYIYVIRKEDFPQYPKLWGYWVSPIILTSDTWGSDEKITTLHRVYETLETHTEWKKVEPYDEEKKEESSK